MRSDVHALKNLIDQSWKIVSYNPIPCGGIDVLRENLDVARRLIEYMLSDPNTVPAATLGKLGGKRTAERGPEYFRKIAAMRKTRAGGRSEKPL